MVGFVLVKSDDESDLTFTVIHNYVYEGVCYTLFVLHVVNCCLLLCLIVRVLSKSFILLFSKCRNV